MGRASEAFMGKRFKLPKFTSAIKLAIVRAAVLKNQRQSRCDLARSDVVQLLQRNLFERAVVRVDQVIKEQNMADVYSMIDSYCHFLLERAYLVEQERECPEELKEAAASLIHASTRCGEFPELQEICAIFTAKYGREFTARAVELRNSCGVNSTMIQKLSTRQIEYDKRVTIVNEIAADINAKGNIESRKQPGWERKRFNHEYENVAEAAQAAFESAAHAAAAARSAVELSNLDNTKSLSKDQKERMNVETKDEDVGRVSLGDGDVGGLGDVGNIVDEEDNNGRQKGELSSENEGIDDGVIGHSEEQSSSRVEYKDHDREDLNRKKTERPRNVFSRLFGRNKGPFSS